MKKGKKKIKRAETVGYFSLARWFPNKDQNLFESLIIRSGLNSFDVRAAGPEVLNPFTFSYCGAYRNPTFFNVV